MSTSQNALAYQKQEQGYRDKALKMYPWVCGRCAREFVYSNSARTDRPPQRTMTTAIIRRMAVTGNCSVFIAMTMNTTDILNM